MANNGQPGRPFAAAGFRVIVLCQYPPHHILIDRDPKGIGDLLSDPRATEPWVAPLHLDDGVDQFLEGPLGPGFVRVRGVKS